MAGNLLCSPDTFAAILVYCSVRDWTRFLRHRIRKYPDSPVHTLSDSLRIYFYHSGERIYFFPDSLSNSPDACARSSVVSLHTVAEPAVRAAVKI